MQHLTVNCSFSYTSWLQLAAESGCSSHCMLTSPLMHWGASHISFQYCFSEKMFFVDVGAEILPSCGSLGLQPQNSHRTPGGAIYLLQRCILGSPPPCCYVLRDRGATKFAPRPQDRVKMLTPPFLKSGNFSCPPYNMAKTSSYCVKTTPKLCVPPFSMAKTVSAPPPFHRDKTSCAPPPFLYPPPPRN